jgi:glyoxylase-like metal-dependent hydrolase (beta-lactamase superfamily II)
VEVSPGIHRLEQPLGNRVVTLTLVRDGGELLLFDSGIADAYNDVVLPYLAEIGASDAELTTVVSSHADFDHVGSNRVIRDARPEVRFLAHAADIAEIEDAEAMIVDRYGEFAGEHGMPSSPETDAFVRSVTLTTSVDESVAEGDVITVGGMALTVLHVPGHSRGHIALWEPRRRLAIIADAALDAALPTVDGDAAFPPTYRDLAPYRATIERLRKLEPTMVVTGHFPVLTGEDVGAFFDRSDSFTRLVDEQLAALLAQAPLTTPEIVATLAPRIGSWPVEAGELGVYPIVGHLEEFEQQGKVARDTNGDGRWLWIWIDD